MAAVGTVRKGMVSTVRPLGSKFARTSVSLSLKLTTPSAFSRTFRPLSLWMIHGNETLRLLCGLRITGRD